MVDAGLADFALIGAVAFTASGLTLYSGFGLGTIVLPAFALFFPVPVAVAATAVVHLLNNVFKGVLVGRVAHWPTVWRLGLPAIPAAIAGGFLLGALNTGPAFQWSAWGRVFAPSPASVAVGALMVLFAAFEALPWFRHLAAPARFMPLGGVIMGFVGGLTGQQGALRSMFLLKSGLDAQHFIATGVIIAILVDMARVPAYAASFAGGSLDLFGREGAMLVCGTLSAFAGAWLGARYLKKATIGTVRAIVAVLMVLVGGALMLGLVGAA